MAYADVQRQSIAKDRIITSFPQAIHSDTTPYKSVNFHPKVRDACTRSSGVRMVKVVVVGEVAVGKTCFVQRFCHDVFDRDYKATIGVDFEVEKFTVLSVPFTVQIWDTAGQERFKSIAASYYRAANAVIVGFDLSSIDSLKKAKQWKEDACANVETENPHIFLVGLKKDLVSESAYRDIEMQALQMAKELRAEYCEVCSKTGENVKEFFFRVAALLFDGAVLRELQAPAESAKKIGTDLIKVEKTEKDGDVGRTKNKLKCCQ